MRQIAKEEYPDYPPAKQDRVAWECLTLAEIILDDMELKRQAQQAAQPDPPTTATTPSPPGNAPGP